MKSNVNIAIDARFLLRPLRGIPLYVLKLCEYLPKLKPNYRFYFFLNKAYEHNDKPENYKTKIDNISVHPNVRIINVEHGGAVYWEQILLPRLVRKYDIKLLHMPANRFCFFSGITTVVTLHDVMEYVYLLEEKYPISWRENRSLRKLQYNMRHRLYVLLTYRKGFRRANKIITVSQNSSRDISNYLNIPERKISVIHHGVDPAFLGATPSHFNERGFVLMLGGDTYQKNPRAAIKAWSLVKPKIRKRFPLKILGFCGSNNSPLLETIREVGLENEIEIKGWVDDTEIVEAFRHAALFLFPSRYEGFGFPLIQAMACGTPVITSNCASIPEVMADVGLMYHPDDVQSMAVGIEKVLKNQMVWQSQSQKGLKRAKIFTWERSIRKHLEIYESLI